MEWLWVGLPALACGAMMLAMCLPMMRQHRGNDAESASKEDVAALREEISRLRAERALSDKERVDG